MYQNVPQSIGPLGAQLPEPDPAVVGPDMNTGALTTTQVAAAVADGDRGRPPPPGPQRQHEQRADQEQRIELRRDGEAEQHPGQHRAALRPRRTGRTR